MKAIGRGLWAFVLLNLSVVSVRAIDSADLLEPAQAFSLEVTAEKGDAVSARWTIAEGYYLYRERLRFESLTPGIRLDEPRLPEGDLKKDDFLGQEEIYRGNITITLPIARAADAPERLQLKVVSQGCSDKGVCFPPQTRTISLDLPPNSKSNPLSALRSAKRFANLGAQDTPLDPEHAFVLSVTAPNPLTLLARWDIAEGYYLYKDKLKLSLVGTELPLRVDLPAGEFKEDEFFGRQEIFHKQALATAHLETQADLSGKDVAVRVSYQGCAEQGICYPPVTKLVSVTLPSLDTSAPTAVGFSPGPTLEPEQDRVARMLLEKRFWALPAFFGFGLLLAFTPCVFPMIPILSSLIVGQGKALSEKRAFLLSLVYVLSMALTYTAAGVLAALLGQNIPALFQKPGTLVGFSVFFVLLALSMFGFYDIHLPSRWQNRLTELSNRQHSGSYLGVALMGLLSALIVSPCVAPPLIAALAVITATASDALLGGVALFTMSLGMGVPLLIIGTSAGRLLPKAGHWMNRIKAVFGVLLLVVAIWMLERILPTELSMLLWATLLIVTATYMGALQPLSHGMPAWRTLIKGLGLVLLIYGILFLVGVASGGRDTLQPLRGANFFRLGLATQSPEFKTVKTVADLQDTLSRVNRQPVMLDFYADWCVSCKELEKYTFADPGVQAALAGTVLLLKADVTANDTDSQALLRHFGLLGPPAIVFFGADGNESKAYRIVGFMSATRFREHIIRFLDHNTVSSKSSMME